MADILRKLLGLFFVVSGLVLAAISLLPSGASSPPRALLLGLLLVAVGYANLAVRRSAPPAAAALAWFIGAFLLLLAQDLSKDLGISQWLVGGIGILLMAAATTVLSVLAVRHLRHTAASGDGAGVRTTAGVLSAWVDDVCAGDRSVDVALPIASCFRPWRAIVILLTTGLGLSFTGTVLLSLHGATLIDRGGYRWLEVAGLGTAAVAGTALGLFAVALLFRKTCTYVDGSEARVDEAYLGRRTSFTEPLRHYAGVVVRDHNALRGGYFSVELQHLDSQKTVILLTSRSLRECRARAPEYGRLLGLSFLGGP